MDKYQGFFNENYVNILRKIQEKARELKDCRTSACEI